VTSAAVVFHMSLQLIILFTFFRWYPVAQIWKVYLLRNQTASDSWCPVCGVSWGTPTTWVKCWWDWAGVWFAVRMWQSRALKVVVNSFAVCCFWSNN